MGQKQTAQHNQQENIHTIEHPRFKQAKFLNDKQGEYIQISVPVVNQNQILNWEKNFKTLIYNQCLLLPISYQFKKTEICGANGICRIKYDNYPFILKDQIKNRSFEVVKPFQNEQIWYLAFNLLEATHIFHANKLKVGDIQPINIFINDNGQMKVGNIYSWPQEMANYEKTVFQKQNTYLAPEELKDIQFGLTESKVNFQIAQSFSVGLTLLDSALLTNSQDIYNLSTNRMDYQKLDSQRDRLRALPQLDDLLKEIIIGLTNTDHVERLKCCEIFASLEPYKQKIINMENFEIKQQPKWMKQSNNLKKNYQVSKPPSQLPFYVQMKQASPPPLIYGNISQKITSTQPISSQISQFQIKQYSPPQYSPSPFIETRDLVNNGYRYDNNPKRVNQLPEKNDDFRSTLQKIEQQLSMSRRMFPN